MKKNGLIDDKYELIIKEFQTFLSVFYVLLIGVGMLFSYSKYSQFGINIFQYSEIFDFLVTPFRDLTVLGVTVFTILMSYLIYKSDRLIKHKFPKFYSSKFNFGLMKSYPIIAVIISFVLYLYIFSETYGKFNKRHFLEKPNTISIQLLNNEIKSGKLIGKNNGYIFMMINDEIKVYPINNSVKEITINKSL